jgi:TRAP-type C4-dicarboxylate transport system permease small subunit
MRKALAGFATALIAICRYGTLAAFGLLIAVVLLQVAGRVPGIPSPPWTEEVARFGLLYLVAFSCGLALLRNELVSVDLLTAPLPLRTRIVIEKIVDVITLGLALWIMPGAWAYVAGSIGERARSIDIPMVTVYAVMLIIPVSLAIFSVLRLLGFGRLMPPASHGELV